MKKVIYLITFAVLFFTQFTTAQIKFDIPDANKLEVAADYVPYEKDIITCSKWLDETPLDSATTKRDRASKFAIKWINGSPTVRVYINSIIINICEKNEKLLAVYMAGSARYQLENKETATETGAIKAGLTSMMTVYKKGIKIKKSKEMEKIIKEAAKDKLDAFIKENFTGTKN
jgi:hypothetical protein